MAKSVYDEVYARSMKDPEGFWARAAEAIHWEKRWDRVFDDSRKPFYRWFTGGVLNTCYNALDLHIDRGRGKQRALVYDSPVTNTVRVFTYAELRAGRRDRRALHPLHVGHDGRAEGGRAGQRWPRGRPQVVHGGDLRRRRGRGVLGGVGYRLGRGPLVHRLRAAARGLHDDPL